MTSLSKFIEMWNGTMPLLDEFDERYIDNIFVADLRDSLSTYLKLPARPLSLSSMGKPLAFLIMSQHGIHSIPAVNGKGRWHLHYGNVAEATVLFLLFSYGVEVDDFQKEVKVGPFAGHIDLRLPDRDKVVDVKSLSGSYFSSFVANPNDDRGYITQVLLYQYALKSKEASVLCVDKMFGGLAEVPVTLTGSYLKDGYEVTGQQLLDMALKKIDVLSGKPDLSEVWETYLPHVAYNIIDKKTKQVPESIRYDSRTHCFFDFDFKSKTVRKVYKAEEVGERVTALAVQDLVTDFAKD